MTVWCCKAASIVPCAFSALCIFSLLAWSTRLLHVSQQAHLLLLHIWTIMLVGCCGQRDGKADLNDHVSIRFLCQ